MKALITICLSIAFYTAGAQVGNIFPTIETETVQGKTVVIPETFLGKYTLIGIGTSKKAEEDLRTWQTPVYNKFIKKTGLMDELYELNVAFLPLFTGASRMAKDKVVKKLRENNERLVIDHVYVYSGNREPFKSIGVEDKAEPYFLMLDSTGKIVWSASGRFKTKYLDQIEDILTH